MNPTVHALSPVLLPPYLHQLHPHPGITLHSCTMVASVATSTSTVPAAELNKSNFSAIVLIVVPWYFDWPSLDGLLELAWLKVGSRPQAVSLWTHCSCVPWPKANLPIPNVVGSLWVNFYKSFSQQGTKIPGRQKSLSTELVWFRNLLIWNQTQKVEIFSCSLGGTAASFKFGVMILATSSNHRQGQDGWPH